MLEVSDLTTSHAELSEPEGFRAEREPPSARARELSLGLGVSLTLAELLERRGHQDVEATRRFLNPRLSELTAPDAMIDRSLAAERLPEDLRKIALPYRIGPAIAAHIEMFSRALDRRGQAAAA